MPALRIAYEIRTHINQSVKDYSCILVKRERVGERLQGTISISMPGSATRRYSDGRVVTPLSVYLYFLRPANIRGREVLYVAGQNDGKLIARRGGSRFSYVTVTLDPLGERAMEGNRYPITEIGIKNLADRLIEAAEDEMQHHPRSDECQVKFFDASEGRRPGVHERLKSPTRCGESIAVSSWFASSSTRSCVCRSGTRRTTSPTYEGEAAKTARAVHLPQPEAEHRADRQRLPAKSPRVALPLSRFSGSRSRVPVTPG